MRAFAYYDVEAKKWRIPPARFRVMVGDSSDALELKGEVEVSAPAASSASF
jgi:hypothetical protein